jgi:hypothetical protein
MRKHAASYRAHESAVAQWKDAAASAVERRNTILEASVSATAATVARRRRELEVLRQRLNVADHGAAPVVDDNVASLQAALREQAASLAIANEARRAAAADAAALRASWSWQVTAPLRALYDIVLGAVGGRNR